MSSIGLFNDKEAQLKALLNMVKQILGEHITCLTHTQRIAFGRMSDDQLITAMTTYIIDKIITQCGAASPYVMWMAEILLNQYTNGNIKLFSDLVSADVLERANQLIASSSTSEDVRERVIKKIDNIRAELQPFILTVEHIEMLQHWLMTRMSVYKDMEGLAKAQLACFKRFVCTGPDGMLTSWPFTDRIYRAIEVQ